MIIIRRVYKGTKQRKRMKVRDYIFDNEPHPRSLAALLLMKRDYYRQDDETINQPWFIQLTFNTKFLKDLLQQKGELVCVYCGKKNLVIENSNKEFLATADHIIPKALGGPAFDINNLVCACHRCNSLKGIKIGYKISEDKYIFEKFPGEFNETKLKTTTKNY